MALQGNARDKRKVQKRCFIKERRKMKIQPELLKFETLLSEFKEQKIKIPEFQRDFVWDKNRIRKLLNSIYHQYPIGSFILWESTDKIKCIDRIGNYKFENEPS